MDPERFFRETASSELARFHGSLRDSLTNFSRDHGRTGEWEDALTAASLPPAERCDFNADTIAIGDESAPLLSDELIKAFNPWRKGPIRLRGTFIDTEWRSDWKWQRIAPHLTPLEGRQVLDIGCGNGYHLFRMLGDGAKLALGIDPTVLFNYQFRLMQSHLPENSAYLLPLRSEDLPAFGCFDTVFSLGVMYHRRSPLDHLVELLSFLRPGGELVLETLVIDGDESTVLLPDDRYAMMRNVFFLPAPDLLTKMVTRAGFRHARVVDDTVTTTDEQRTTPFMTFQSLPDFLDPNDSSRTIEGYPAPRRATVIAERPV